MTKQLPAKLNSDPSINDRANIVSTINALIDFLAETPYVQPENWVTCKNGCAHELKSKCVCACHTKNYAPTPADTCTCLRPRICLDGTPFCRACQKPISEAYMRKRGWLDCTPASEWEEEWDGMFDWAEQIRDKEWVHWKVAYGFTPAELKTFVSRLLIKECQEAYNEGVRDRLWGFL